MNKVIEPNWDSLGDKELQSIIRSRTGEEVNPGRMNHAALVAKARHAFIHGAEENADGRGTAPVATSARGTDTDPKSGKHPADELAGSASGNALTDEQPENKAITGKDGKKPAQDGSRNTTAKEPTKI